MIRGRLPITVLVAVKNEEINISRCLSSLTRADQVVVLDSQSTDNTCTIAIQHGASVVQFYYSGGYPKKRQWALDTLPIDSPWILLLDADEFVPPGLWDEIEVAISRSRPPSAFLITKGFHFLGKRFRFGGFSHAAILLFRRGMARFESLLDDSGHNAHQLDMEVHERMIVEGEVGTLKTPLTHEDFKGLHAYVDRHNRYSTWEAAVRSHFLRTGQYGTDAIQPRLFGNAQERRRFLKYVIMRMPFEHWLWFGYHYIVRLGILEGRAGLIASQIRSSYILQTRAKMYEANFRTSN